MRCAATLALLLATAVAPGCAKPPGPLPAPASPPPAATAPPALGPWSGLVSDARAWKFLEAEVAMGPRGHDASFTAGGAAALTG